MEFIFLQIMGHSHCSRCHCFTQFGQAHSPLAMHRCIFTATEISKRFNATHDQSWLIVLTWWMSPVVFNANLFDFHPEVCFLPLIVYAFCYIKDYKHPLIILGLLLCTLLARDGNILLLIGVAITLFIRRKFALSFALFTCSCCGFYF